MSLLDILFDDETATTNLKILTADIKNKGGGSNNVWFRYRNLDVGASCTVRFLPASEGNVAGRFWVPKKVVRLKFADPVNVGQDVNITVPVLQMYVGGKASEDPILGQATMLYEQADALEKKGESEKAKQVRGIASAHYIRGEAIAQGFVVHPGFLEQDPPENPIRLFELNKQIIKVITSKLETENPELQLDSWPCHGKRGYNFIIKKTKTGDGKFPKYDDGTGFSSKTSPWTGEQTEEFKKHGLWDLTSFLPQRPSDDEYKVLAEIVHQSIAGDRVWNPDWEAHLSAVKLFRTAQAEPDGDEPASYSDQMKESLARINSKPTDTSAVVTALNRTGSKPVDTDHEPEAGEEPVITAKSGAEVKSLMEKLKQERNKTAVPGE